MIKLAIYTQLIKSHLLRVKKKLFQKMLNIFFVPLSHAGRFFEFVCVDEIQLAADYERGHIFTRSESFFHAENKKQFF